MVVRVSMKNFSFSILIVIYGTRFKHFTFQVMCYWMKIENGYLRANFQSTVRKISQTISCS